MAEEIYPDLGIGILVYHLADLPVDAREVVLFRPVPPVLGGRVAAEAGGHHIEGGVISLHSRRQCAAGNERVDDKFVEEEWLAVEHRGCASRCLLEAQDRPLAGEGSAAQLHLPGILGASLAVDHPHLQFHLRGRTVQKAVEVLHPHCRGSVIREVRAKLLKSPDAPVHLGSHFRPENRIDPLIGRERWRAPDTDHHITAVHIRGQHTEGAVVRPCPRLLDKGRRPRQKQLVPVAVDHKPLRNPPLRNHLLHACGNCRLGLERHPTPGIESPNVADLGRLKKLVKLQLSGNLDYREIAARNKLHGYRIGPLAEPSL